MAKIFKFPEKITTNTLIRVTYQNSDQMGVVYYANYFIWFEVGRVELLRRFGTSYKDFEKQGMILPVRSCSCDYIKSAKFDDIIRIETTLEELTKISLNFAYKIYLYGTEELLAEGKTTHIFINKEGKIERHGDKIYNIISGYNKQQLDELKKPISNVEIL